jgi:energy-coupling factor transport system substrate-specific component
VSWQLASSALLVIVLALGFAWFERSRPPAKVVALVAALAALATVGRIAFAPIPNVKPTTDIALFAGYALGPVPGFAVGSIAALVSNIFFGQGPWTPWQMLAWGLSGVLGGVLAAVAGRDLGRAPLAAACAFAGLMFGAILDLYQWTQGGAHDLAAYVTWSATSLPYNLAHIMGNIAFCLLLGPTFVRSLERFRRRFEVRWAPAAAGLLLVVAVLTAGPVGQAQAASPAGRAVSYLARAQNSDGGFGGAPGASSTQLHTGWAALGFAAAGRNPVDVSSAGNSIIDYVRSHAGSLRDTGDLERAILTVRAAGVSARSFAGRDLVADLLSRRAKNGSWSNNNTWTSFGILALRAAGSGGVSHSAGWLAKRQNRDGGFGFQPRAASTADDTGAALEALGAAGRGGTRAARRAVSYLRGSQHSDGGFGQMRTQPSNSQSTAWAVQGLVAAGRSPGSRALAYLRSLQSSDGSIRYSRQSRQTPVWTTAQALDALEQKAFPLQAPARNAAASGSGSAAAPRTPAARARAKRAKRAAGRPARPATATTPAAAPAQAPPSAATQRAAATRREHSSGGGGFAWGAAVAAGAIAAVAAFAVWRLARRKQLRGA